MGIANYVQQNSFIVPFPFIGEFVFSIVITICILDYKSFAIRHFFLFFFALFGVLAGRFIWELFLDYEQLLYLFEETIFIDLFKIIQYLFLFGLILVIAITITDTKKRFLLGITGLLLPVLLAINGTNILNSWFVFLGLNSFLVLRFGGEIKAPIKSILECFVGIGILYLLSLVTQLGSITN